MKAIERVRVMHGDDVLGARVLEIKGSQPTFETPTRSVTTTEMNAKTNIHLDEAWDNPVFEYNNRYKQADDLRGLHRKNGVFARRLRAVKSEMAKFQGYALTKYHPQLPQDTRLSDRDTRVLVDLQIEAGCDVITLPEPYAGCPAETFVGTLNNYWEYVQRHAPHKAIMPYLHLAQDPERFEKKLEVIADHEHSLWALGIRFASINEYRPNLMSLAEISDRDLWVHCSAGRRYPNHRKPVGHLHALQRFGVDTVATEVPQAFPGKKPEGMPSPREQIKDVRYFDAANLLFPKLEEILKGSNELPCGCPACERRNLDEVSKRLLEIERPDEIKLRMNDTAKVHEVYTSTDEFERSRTSIAEGEVRRYFQTKSSIHEYIGET